MNPPENRTAKECSEKARMVFWTAMDLALKEMRKEVISPDKLQAIAAVAESAANDMEAVGTEEDEIRTL